MLGDKFSENEVVVTIGFFFFLFYLYNNNNSSNLKILCGVYTLKIFDLLRFPLRAVAEC
jgi:hypothetical protein